MENSGKRETKQRHLGAITVYCLICS